LPTKGTPTRLEPDAEHYLTEYTDHRQRYASATYDQAPVHDGLVTGSDVLMVNLRSLLVPAALDLPDLAANVRQLRTVTEPGRGRGGVER
jgi:hypothetical protein